MGKTTTEQVANQLVSFLRQGNFEGAQTDLFHTNVVSIEPEKANLPQTVGLQAILDKGAEFRASVESWHGITVSEPVVADLFFSLALKVDLTFKGQERSAMNEIIVYETDGDKIVSEIFYY